MGEAWEKHGILLDDAIRYSSGWIRVRAIWSARHHTASAIGKPLDGTSHSALNLRPMRSVGVLR
jgi:hypothetical protein